MLCSLIRRALAIALLIAALGASAERPQAEDAPKRAAPNEAEEILQDSKKQDPETSKEVADCMKQWGPQTQMTKEEWAASCRRTLRYFPENQ